MPENPSIRIDEIKTIRLETIASSLGRARTELCTPTEPRSWYRFVVLLMGDKYVLAVGDISSHFFLAIIASVPKLSDLAGALALSKKEFWEETLRGKVVAAGAATRHKIITSWRSEGFNVSTSPEFQKVLLPLLNKALTKEFP